LDVGLRRPYGILGFGNLRLLRRLPRLEVFDRGLGPEQIGLGLRYSSPVIVIVDLDQEVAFFDALEVVDRDPAHIAINLSAERRNVAADISIVGDLPDRQTDPAVPLRRKQHDNKPRGNQDRQPDERDAGPPAPPCRSLDRRRRRRGGVAIGGQQLFGHNVNPWCSGAGTPLRRFQERWEPAPWP
jgi:hypothetical protein